MELTFGNYKLLEVLGVGSSSKVFKALNIKSNEMCALKIYNTLILDQNDSEWKRIQKEYNIHLKLMEEGHPNIIKIRPPQLINNHAVMEMELIDGETLYSYLKNNRFISIDEFYNFAEQIVGAVAFCHVFKSADTSSINIDKGSELTENGDDKDTKTRYCIIHNDLHPCNIIRRKSDGKYVLIDFTLSNQGSYIIKSERIMGPVEYSAPEKKQRATKTTQSDVYSLGVMLYEMLTHQHPFSLATNGNNRDNRILYKTQLEKLPIAIFNLRKKIFEEDNPGLTYHCDYNNDLAFAIMKCLAFEPKDRYSDAQELLKIIKMCIADSPAVHPYRNMITGKDFLVPTSLY